MILHGGALKATNALLAYCKNSKLKSKADLLDVPDTVSIQIQLSTIPSDSLDPIKIPLPHDILLEDAEVCLITKDPPDMYQEMLADQLHQDLTMQRVTKVMGVKTLRKEYKEFEKKRKLCNDFAVFITDDRVKALLPDLLGKSFYKAKKFPVAVKLPRTKAGSLTRPVSQALGGTYVVLRQGSCSMVKVGHTGMEASEIADNVCAAASVLGKIMKNKAKIQAMFLKTADSVALPLYTHLPAAPLEIKRAKTAKAVPSTKRKTDNRKKPARPLMTKKGIKKPQSKKKLANS